MSLDKNLFTLHITPSKDDQHGVDLADPSGTLHYHKRRIHIEGGGYKAQVFDPLSGSLLVTVDAPSVSSKTKVLELCNPTKIVSLKHTGNLSFKWKFQWEDHEFEWKKEECFLIRRPDPPVLVAVTRELPPIVRGASKVLAVQILDYNINRFDFEDKKGLEIVILTTLLTFQDFGDAKDAKPEAASAAAPASPGPPPNFSTVSGSGMGALGLSLAALSFSSSASSVNPEAPPKPPRPPKPIPKTGVSRIAEMQLAKEEINEVLVEEEGEVADYAEYCHQMLEDDAMLFITVKSMTSEMAPKVIQIVEEAKRLRYKAGLEEEEKLYQYVLHDAIKAQPKGPRRINLDEPERKKNKGKYAPPSNLTIHLSKIPMPELQPKTAGPRSIGSVSSMREDKLASRPAPPRPNSSGNKYSNLNSGLHNDPSSSSLKLPPGSKHTGGDKPLTSSGTGQNRQPSPPSQQVDASTSNSSGSGGGLSSWFRREDRNKNKSKSANQAPPLPPFQNPSAERHSVPNHSQPNNAPADPAPPFRPTSFYGSSVVSPHSRPTSRGPLDEGLLMGAVNSTAPGPSLYKSKPLQSGSRSMNRRSYMPPPPPSVPPQATSFGSGRGSGPGGHSSGVSRNSVPHLHTHTHAPPPPAPGSHTHSISAGENWIGGPSAPLVGPASQYSLPPPPHSLSPRPQRDEQSALKLVTPKPGSSNVMQGMWGLLRK